MNVQGVWERDRGVDMGLGLTLQINISYFRWLKTGSVSDVGGVNKRTWRKPIWTDVEQLIKSHDVIHGKNMQTPLREATPNPGVDP